MSSINAAASGQFKIGGDLTVNRLGYGVNPRILRAELVPFFGPLP
jgi:hypothetical protein